MYRTVINYRREDSGAWAGRLYDRLVDHFGEEDVFIDVNAIEVGQEYRAVILKNVASCYVLIPVIGTRWAECRDRDGNRRLDIEDDLLREEIRVAIEKRVELFPVLVDDAPMPQPEILTRDIQGLANRQAHELNLKHFKRDVNDLIEKIDLVLKVAEERKRPVSLKETIKDLEKQLAEARQALGQERQEQQDTLTCEPKYAAPISDQASSKPFNAFMVYSHARDKTLAASLQSGLQKFTKPWYKSRALRIFRDATDLTAVPALWASIKGMIDSSEYMILLASPEAARSKWVEAEVGYWLEKQPSSKILIALTGGEIRWDASSSEFDWTKTDALPPIMRGAFSEEPFYIDLRWAVSEQYLSLRNPQFLESVAQFAAVLHSKPLDILYGQDANHERRIKHLMLIVFLIISLLVIYAAVVTSVALRSGQ